MVNPLKISFFYQQKKVPLAERTRLKIFIQKLFISEKKKLGSLSYIFCTDKYLLKINKDYLGHDYYTDIITFDISDSDEYIQAEIYISAERVWDNAQKFGISFKSELHRVIFHGALHLCGYGDKTKVEKEKMRRKEDFYLKSFFS